MEESRTPYSFEKLKMWAEICVAVGGVFFQAVGWIPSMIPVPLAAFGFSFVVFLAILDVTASLSTSFRLRINLLERVMAAFFIGACIALMCSLLIKPKRPNTTQALPSIKVDSSLIVKKHPHRAVKDQAKRTSSFPPTPFSNQNIAPSSNVVQSIGQTGGFTGIVAPGGRVDLAEPSRKFSAEQMDSLIAYFSPYKGESIKILVVNSTPESREFSGQIEKIFTSAGLKVETIQPQLFGGNNPTGIVAEVGRNRIGLMQEIGDCFQWAAVNGSLPIMVDTTQRNGGALDGVDSNTLRLKIYPLAE